MVTRGIRLGAESWVLLEEDLARVFCRSNAVHPALARHGPVGRRGDQVRGNRGVVGQHFGLGGAGLRVDDFAQVREGQLMTLNDDTLLLLSCHLFSSVALCC